MALRLQLTALAVVALAAAVAPSATGQTTDHNRPARLDFVFDDGFYGSPELQFNFSREAISYSVAGEQLAAHVPRFAQPRLLASAPLAQMVRYTDNATRIFATGLDHDGTTPLMVVYESAVDYLDVFTVAGDAVLTAEQTGEGRNRSLLDAGAHPDLLGGIVADRCFHPHSGAICHGLIVLACKVWQSDDGGGSWAIGGTAIFTSQDQGLSWQLLYAEQDVDVGRDRGREWSLQNWFPTQPGEAPLEACFTLTDYLYNPGATGGRVYFFRATRPAVGEPWHMEPVQVIFEGGHDLVSQHAHAAGVLPHDEAGVRVLAAFGDALDKNRIVSITQPNWDYVDQPWLILDDFHGSHRRPAELDPRQSVGPAHSGVPSNELLGFEGNQFVGCAPTADLEGLLVGGDLRHESIVRLQPDPSDPSRPFTSFIYGSPLANGELSECFIIRTPTPEQGGPYTARYSPRTNGATPPDPYAPRVLFSPDGEHWGQAWAHGISNARPAVHGPHIYLDSHIDNGGIRRISTPNWVTGRPLSLAPGGLQKQAFLPFFISNGYGSVERLERDGTDQVIFEGEPLPIQPPTGGPVYHIRSSRSAPNDYLGYFLPMSYHTGLGSQLQSDWVASRWWVLPHDRCKTARLHLEFVENFSPILTTRRTVLDSVDRWLPQVVLEELPVADDLPLRQRVYAGPNDVSDRQDLFVAFDLLLEGSAVASYPMKPVRIWSEPLPILPDEVASITGFACGEQWAIILAAEVPDDSWDSTVALPDVLPLFTIWGDEENYIEYYADVPAQQVKAAIVSGGELATTMMAGGVIYWLRGSSFIVAVTDAGDDRGIRSVISPANHPPRAMSGGTPHGDSASLAVQPTEIRFSSHHGTSGAGGETIHVTPLLWWGGEVRTHESMEYLDMRDQLLTLDFLWRLELPPADLDKDGRINRDDLGILLASYGRSTDDPRCDRRGDLNADGVVDLSDLGALLPALDP